MKSPEESDLYICVRIVQQNSELKQQMSKATAVYCKICLQT